MGCTTHTPQLRAPYPGRHEPAHTGGIGDGGQDQRDQSCVGRLAVGERRSLSFAPSSWPTMQGDMTAP